MKNWSILSQLLLNVIAPVIIVLGVISFLNYKNELADRKQGIERQKEILVEEVKALLSARDESLLMVEADMNKRMRELSYRVRERFSENTSGLTNYDMGALSLELGLDTANEEIYIFDSTGVVINTSFPKDIGFKFYSDDPADRYGVFFTSLKQDTAFVSERFATETLSKRPRKFTYLPTYDHQYVIEFGFLSEKYIALNQFYDSLLASIGNQFRQFNDVTLFAASEAAPSPEEGAVLDSSHLEAFIAAFTEKKTMTVESQGDELITKVDFVPIEMKNTNVYSGYVIRIVSDNAYEKEILASVLKRFALIFLITILPLVLLVYFRAKALTKPLSQLMNKAAAISKGNLSERTEMSGSREVKTLSDSFNLMVEQLEESYNTLEEKVKDRTAEVVHQKEIIQEKQKEIIDSINYAKRIQYALLAHDDLLKENLPEYFVFFCPKDIVSGDFYWGCSTGESFYIAVCDSTGHGVPGAFMSLLNISFLNEAIIEKKIYSPGEIFDHVRMRLVSSISKDGAQDGMDATLVRFDRTSKRITYAGANNAPVIVTEGVATTLSYDKMPVGKGEKEESFASHSIEATPGSMVYLFTDGYGDQFGGPKGKKFKYRTLVSLLEKHAHLQAEDQQQQLKQAFAEWKGTHEQVDDVCIIGIRV